MVAALPLASASFAMGGSGGDYGGRGTDGNNNSRGSESKMSVELDARPQLNSDWGFQAQFNAIKRMGAPDDLTFKENSVKEVTDKGRQRGVAVLQAALEEVVARIVSVKTCDRELKRSARGSGRSPKRELSPGAKADATELRREVRGLCQRLQLLRESGALGAAGGADAFDLIRELGDLPVTVACLKATKVAVELNHADWRGVCVPTNVREHAAALVRRWLAMYRNEEGRPPQAGNVAKASQTRQCPNIAADLEEKTHATQPKAAKYVVLVESVCAFLRRDRSAAMGLFTGGSTSQSILADVTREMIVSARARDRLHRQ